MPDFSSLKRPNRKSNIVLSAKTGTLGYRSSTINPSGVPRKTPRCMSVLRDPCHSSDPSGTPGKNSLTAWCRNERTMRTMTVWIVLVALFPAHQESKAQGLGSVSGIQVQENTLILSVGTDRVVFKACPTISLWSTIGPTASRIPILWSWRRRLGHRPR